MRSQTGRSIVRVIAVLLCLAGFLLSLYLTNKHWTANQPGGAPAEAGFAGLLDKACTTLIPEANCDEVVGSHWGTIPGTNLPTAQLGLYYFTALFWWFLLVGDTTYSRRGVHLLLAAIMAVSLGFSIFLAYQIKYKLPHPCTWCLVTHAANALLFLCMLLLWPRRPRAVPATLTTDTADPMFATAERPPNESADWPTGWALLVLPIIILLSFAMETRFSGRTGNSTALVQQMNERIASAERETETYRNLAAGKDMTKEINSMTQQLRDQEEQRREADIVCQRKVSGMGDQMVSMQKQIEMLQKANEGKAGATEVTELQKKLRTSEAYKQYFEEQFRRYDNRWQHTFTSWTINPPVQISLQNTPIRGPANARHTLTIYSDYQCPTCKKFEETLMARIVPLTDRYGGLRLVFKVWPISTKCNPKASNDLHPSACDAALAAQAAFILGGNDAFWKMHDLLFANQDEWKANPNFDKYASQIGLNLDAFHKTMQSPDALARVQADINEGISLGKDLLDHGLITSDEQAAIKVDSTPSIFVDNKRLQSAQHFKTWQMILSNPTPPWQPERRTGSSSSRPSARGPAGSSMQLTPATQPRP